jgi:hypothetical protein
MSSGLTTRGEVPDAAKLLGRLDAQVSAATTKVRAAGLSAYRTTAPGRVAGGVKVRRDSTLGQRLVITVGKVPMGGKVNGRDVGTQAVAYWTNFGTRGPIKLRRPARLPNGRIVHQVAGQRPQNWIAEARRQADAAAAVLIDQHLADDVADMLERSL